MSGGGRKFNIWIVYSDLFTNLATFLFISALGVFAAFGSGVFAEGGPGGEERCRAQLERAGSLLGAGSVLEPIGSRAVSGNDRACARYYRMGDLQFRSIVPSIYHLKDDSLQAITRPELIRRVCVPLWRALEDRAFREAGGAVTLVGLRVASDDYSYVPRCSLVEHYDPILAEPPVRRFPAGRRPIDVIHDCQDPRLGSANPLLCPDILECIGGRETGEWCERVRAVELRGRQIAAACEQTQAERQAKLIYDICESAPLETHFERWRGASERAQQGASPAKRGAGRPSPDPPAPEGERRKWWWNVGFDGLTRDWPTLGSDGEEDEERNILVPDPGGTAVVVKVEFPR